MVKIINPDPKAMESARKMVREYLENGIADLRSYLESFKSYEGFARNEESPLNELGKVAQIFVNLSMEEILERIRNYKISRGVAVELGTDVREYNEQLKLVLEDMEGVFEIPITFEECIGGIQF